MKLQKKFKMLFNIFAVIIGVYALFMIPVIGVPVIGGVILQGILGGFSGKVGPVVGGKWKDIDYMRSYVIPANPNTSAQQAVRAKFAQLVSTARLLLSTILQVYWDPFLSSMSGFNSWISNNYSLSDSNGDIDETAIIAKGTLESVSGFAGTYNTGTGSVQSSFDGTIVGNGSDNDFILLVAYDSVNKVFYYSTGQETRSVEADSLSMPTGLTATNVFIYMFCFRGTGSEFVVSDSIGAVCSAS